MVFLEGEQRFRLLQSRRQAAILLLELPDLRIDGRRLPPACLRRQPGLALLAPRVQVRRVESLGPQQRPQLSMPRTGVRPPKDRQLVSGREASTRMARGDFGIRHARHDVGLACGRPSARAASLCSSPLRSGSPTRDWVATIERILLINVLTPPRPQH